METTETKVDVAAELKALEDRSGKLTASEVVDAARPENSPLHVYFTWEDSEAAERWRLEEARELIRSVRIEVTVEDREVRTIGYVRDVTRPPAHEGYISTMKVKAKDGRALVAEELHRIVGLSVRLCNIVEARGDIGQQLSEEVGKVHAAAQRALNYCG